MNLNEGPKNEFIQKEINLDSGGIPLHSEGRRLAIREQAGEVLSESEKAIVASYREFTHINGGSEELRDFAVKEKLGTATATELEYLNINRKIKAAGGKPTDEDKAKLEEISTRLDSEVEAAEKKRIEDLGKNLFPKV